MGSRRPEIPKIQLHSTLLMISFRMVPHMISFGVPIGTGTSWSMCAADLILQVQGVLGGF